MLRSAIRFLTQKEATAVDVELMATPGFSVDQLMELAGLSVACSVFKVFPPDRFRRVMVVCGPGNNGGDGFVCARHLWHFGYRPALCYPRPSNKPLYVNMITQCKQLDISVSSSLPQALDSDCDLLVDAIFGFSFKGSIRAPFDDVVKTMKSSALPCVSVDIPSGWDVEKGDVLKQGLHPDMLVIPCKMQATQTDSVQVSLTAPKLCAKFFTGKYHFLGGRFVPLPIRTKYDLQLPEYPGCEQCVQLPPQEVSEEEKSA